MRIDILAVGSHGDVRPAVALGLGLRDAGHRVRIAALDGFEAFVRTYGLDYVAIGRSPRTIAGSEAGKNWIARRRTTIGFLRGFVGVARTLIEQGIATYWPACQDVEALIVSPLGLPVGVHIAERLGVPLIRAYYSPFAPTRYDWAGRRNLRTALRGEVTALAGAAFRLAMWSSLRATTNTARRTVLGLPALPLREPFGAMDARRIPVLNAYSPAVVPRPLDWPAWNHVTGYWFLDEPADWIPPATLVDFLASGAPPVFVGFGSTPFPEPGQATALVVDALTQAGQRGVVVAGGSGLATGRLTDDILSIESVPHAWLLPQACAAVHHGGAGVTGAALRAGLPAVVVPVFADQPFWGGRVFDLGAGPRPIPAARLTADALATALRATRERKMRRSAATLGQRIRAEDGVARAVESVHRHLGVAPRAVRRPSAPAVTLAAHN